MYENEMVSKWCQAVFLDSIKGPKTHKNKGENMQMEQYKQEFIEFICMVLSEH